MNKKQSDPDYTVNLEAQDDAEALYYRVAVTDVDDNIVDGFVHKTENYNEALIYAKTFFDTITQGNIVVACYVEQPGKLAGQGALYSIGKFAARPSEVVSEEELYDNLAEDFMELCRHSSHTDVNVVFRKVVARHKLDFYKESKLLQHLQKLGILEIISRPNEFWVEE